MYTANGQRSFDKPTTFKDHQSDCNVTLHTHAVGLLTTFLFFSLRNISVTMCKIGKKIIYKTMAVS